MLGVAPASTEALIPRHHGQGQAGPGPPLDSSPDMSEASPDRRTQKGQLPGLEAGILGTTLFRIQLPCSAEQQSR